MLNRFSGLKIKLFHNEQMEPLAIDLKLERISVLMGLELGVPDL